MKMNNLYKFLLFIFFSRGFAFEIIARDSLFVSFPNGISTHLILENSGVIPSGLQARFPSLQAFKARNKFFPNTDFRIQFSNGVWEIYQIDGDHIIKLSRNKEGIWEEEIRDEFHESINCITKEESNQRDLSKSSRTITEDSLRIYRLALAATGEFSAFHGGDIPKVLAVLVGMVNLVNAVFERDLGVRFTLVNQSDDLIFQYAGADPFTQGNESSQNQDFLDRFIGDDFYDVGHVLGGLKSVSMGKIGSICQKGEKGLGVSTSLIPDGLSFIFDYFSHELAHQLGGNHSFNSIICNQQRHAKTAWEPGSGISILGYPGLCASDNLAAHVLPHFHSGSIEEIAAHLVSRADKKCGVKVPARRTHSGEVKISDHNLPVNTPFFINPEMDGFGKWFSWESFDLGDAMPLNMSKGSSPNLPLTKLKNNASRSFPSLDSLVKAAWEPGVVLADYTRIINLRLTRRDSLKLDRHSFSLKVTDHSGPFRLTLPREDLFNTGISPILVTWDPARTFLPPVSANSVDLFLVDIFNPDTLIYLLKNIPNLGRVSTYLPLHLPKSSYKIGVKGTNKLFFNLSPGKINFNKNAELFFNPISKEPTTKCGGEVTFQWDFSEVPGHFFPMTLKINERLGWTYSWYEKILLKPEQINFIVRPASNQPISGVFETNLQVLSSGQGFNFPLEWISFAPKEIKVEQATPAEKTEIFELKPLFSWKTNQKADWYRLEISSNQGFDSLLDSVVTVEHSAFAHILLEPGRTYYWRIKHVNILCGAGKSEVFSFSTGNATCKSWQSSDSILLNQIPFRQTNLVVEQKGYLSDISELWVSLNISKWEGVKIFLKTPSGKRRELEFPKRCTKNSQWQYLKFIKNNIDTASCTSGDTLLIYDFPLFSELKGESLNGLWQLLFEGVNQQGIIGNWGIRGCYPEQVTGKSYVSDHKASVSIFPNPAREKTVTLVFQNIGSARIILWDIYGKKMGEWKKESGLNQLFIPNLEIANGMYVWEMIDDRNQREVLKWMLHE
jgi:hypothetical protein